MMQQIKNKLNQLKATIRTNKKSVIFLCCFIFFAASYTIIAKYDLVYNGEIINGTIEEVSSHSKGGLNFVFTYQYEGTEQKSSTSTSLKHPNQFIGKSFPVIISTLTGQTELLVTPQQFKKYRLPFPDSLKWVLQYVKPF